MCAKLIVMLVGLAHARVCYGGDDILRSRELEFRLVSVLLDNDRIGRQSFERGVIGFTRHPGLARGRPEAFHEFFIARFGACGRCENRCACKDK